MGGACSTKWEVRNSHKILVGNPEGKRILSTHGPRWYDDIKKELRKIRLECVDCFCVSQDKVHCRAVVMNLLFPLKAEKFLDHLSDYQLIRICLATLLRDDATNAGYRQADTSDVQKTYVISRARECMSCVGPLEMQCRYYNSSRLLWSLFP
jgi:hypothetical protein